MKCLQGSWKLNWFEKIGFGLLVIFYCFSRDTFALTLDNSTSTFVERCRVDCSLRKDFVTCGKYRVVRWLRDVVNEKEFNFGSLRIVRIPSMPGPSIIPKLPQSRAFKTDVIEALNFARDAVDDLLTKRALVYTVDNSISARSFGSAPMILDEDEFAQLQNRKEDDWRLFKKKKSVIVPILILINLLKLKLLLLPIFLSVHFIKKLLVFASIIIPSLLTRLKICKVPQPPHHQQAYPYHMWGTAVEAPVDYPTAYDESWSHRSDYVNPAYIGYQGYRNPYG
ncbi:hypothetical protein K0M31_009190 [Melipona bicolor]|uniref:Uncharacterized protein n=1 Tax=Melipona bicolor TaxID=60889 RepID=A0AA40FP49_9HYME|nr:hypothetical protein K0M31_009190 [Melipona bicolor]